MSKTSIIRARLPRKKYTAQQIFLNSACSTAMASFLFDVFFFLFIYFVLMLLFYLRSFVFLRLLLDRCKKARNAYGQTDRQTDRQRDKHISAIIIKTSCGAATLAAAFALNLCRPFGP